MPKTMHVCSRPGCPNLIPKPGLCATDKQEADRRRGSRQSRGYDRAHELERKRWAPAVALGKVECKAPTCVMRSRRILPGQAWDLGHTEDRSTWRGPEHMQCNRGWRRNQA